MNNRKVLVLGGGMIGSYIARQLKASGFNVEIADNDLQRCTQLSKETGITTKCMNADDSDRLYRIVRDYKLVINALPGKIAYQALEAVIHAGTDCVDISFMPEDPRRLHEAAKERLIRVIPDCGIAPGFCGMIIGHELRQNDNIDLCVIRVGGLPKKTGFKALFSVSDIIEEYTREVRYKEDGQILTVPALSDVDYPYFDEKYFGGYPVELESFMTDGLRTLIDLPIPNMEERTLRHSGHATEMEALRKYGLLDDPHTVQILTKRWERSEDDDEFTIMKISLEGDYRREKCVEKEYIVYGQTDPNTRETSMARMTGLPAVTVARMLLDGRRGEFDPGITMPEHCSSTVYEAVSDALRNDGIEINIDEDDDDL